MQESDLFDFHKSQWLEVLVQKNHSVEVALSGGLDSMVLLSLMVRLRNEHFFDLGAVHVHHGLQEEADEWVDFCQYLCRSLGVSLRTEYIVVDPNSSLGIEGEARKKRYDCFYKSSYSLVALAHHKNDQVETFFLSVLRGGGVRGLAAMPIIRHLSNSSVQLWRPLLDLDRSEIKQYAENHQVAYIEDPSNNNEIYLRNWVRKSLLPFIEKKIPYLNQHIYRNIVHIQHVLNLVQEVSANDLEMITKNDIFFVPIWLGLSEARRSEALKKFVVDNGLDITSYEHLATFSHWLYHNAKKKYKWHFKNGTIYLYNDRLWVEKYSDFILKRFIHDKGGWLKEDIKWIENKEGLSEDFLQGKWSIRKVQSKDKINIKIGSKSVLKILQEKKIPPHVRCYWPVVVDQNEICIAVVGIRIDDAYLQPNGVVPMIEAIQYFLGTNCSK